MGNRIYGCDDCQLYCPWNRYAGNSAEPDFEPRGQLAGASLLALFAWSEDEFSAQHGGFRDPSDQLRAVAAEPGGGDRQRSG